MSPSRRGEEGFSLVEVVVTMAVMSIVATAVISVAMRVFGDTATIVNRRDVFADARIALDRMAKQFRQGESIEAGASDAGQVTMLTYLDGVPTRSYGGWTASRHRTSSRSRRRGHHVHHRVVIARTPRTCSRTRCTRRSPTRSRSTCR